ncbi:ribbon-helix-helix domain-containing protein [Hyphomicrobium sp. NDB2Meth4]|uniref:ribbon-helix-helix domain-containing protein n=1 Tax=Hyphomicrobium sp. NDB2Meth4 TaxID=1892846 RepID=UPI00093089C0|nr:ribbon-helix-helix domain-containing protein [Hyphomicrobium sp. NDB2Meth4]
MLQQRSWREGVPSDGKRPTKRSVIIGKRRTSVIIEDVFWDGLKEMARRRRRTMNRVLLEIATTADEGQSLSSAIRVAVFLHFYDIARGHI